MHVRVRLFAALRERVGSGSIEIELPDDARVGDVWGALDLGDEPPGILFALNRAYAERTASLNAGDEIALIPPVSGGSFRLVEEPLSLDAAVDEVRERRSGRDRDLHRDRAQPVARTRRGPPRVRGLRGHGRGGHGQPGHEAHGAPRPVRRLDPPPGRPRRDRRGQRSHRRLSPAPGEALAACKEAIDELKVSVPLWKKEIYEGGEEWIGQGS